MIDIYSYQAIYKIAKIVKNILYTIFLIFFVFYSYQLYRNNFHFVTDYFKINIKSDNSPLFSYFWQQVRLLKNYLLQCSFVFLSFRLYCIVPIKKKWLIFWENNQQINPILGRYLCQHFRYYHTINHKYFFALCSYSYQQKSILLKYRDNTEFYDFLKKYDQYIEKDLL